MHHETGREASPAVEPHQRCGDWRPDDAATREHMDCKLCVYGPKARGMAIKCHFKAPTRVSAEGVAIFPKCGPWCGDFEMEAGVGNDEFRGIIPGFPRDMIEKAKNAA